MSLLAQVVVRNVLDHLVIFSEGLAVVSLSEVKVGDSQTNASTLTRILRVQILVFSDCFIRAAHFSEHLGQPLTGQGRVGVRRILFEEGSIVGARPIVS